MNTRMAKKGSREHIQVEMRLGTYSGAKRLAQWKLRLPMQPLPRLTQTLETIRQEEENRGTPGPYRLVETAYKSLNVVRQRYTEHKENKMSLVQDTIDDINREQLELGRSIASFLGGFRPLDTYHLLIQFLPDTDRRFIAQLLGGM